MVTNCVNCGAPINLNVDKCEYCDSSYYLMGVKTTVFVKKDHDTKIRAKQRLMEIEKLRRKADIIQSEVAANSLYLSALQAMKKYSGG